MKKLTLSLFICLCTFSAFSQADSTISLDILRAPSHPSFTLLGIAPESIETPQDPTNVLVSLRNATDNFSTLPKSYAIDIAPAWIFKNNVSANSFLNSKGDKPLANIWQTFRLSLATHTPNDGVDSSLTQMGIGFKTSIFRGNKLSVNWDSSRQKVDSIRNFLKDRTLLLGKYLDIFREESIEYKTNNDSLNKYLGLESSLNTRLAENSNLANDRGFSAQLSKVKAEVAKYLTLVGYADKKVKREATEHINDSLKAELAVFKKLTSEIQFRRYGWKLDLAGGIVLDYPTQNFDYSLLTRYGAWLTGGYETKKAVNFLAVSRIMLNPAEVYLDENDSMQTADNLNFDAGAKIEWIPNGGMSKFRLSGEGIYRTTFNNSDIDDRIRYTINLSYEIEKNTLLNFSVGKNFDTPTKVGGNLIAALNLLIGFGNNRPVLK
ncbi:MAG: hypothetical protein ACN6I4_01470 [bacterium]